MLVIGIDVSHGKKRMDKAAKIVTRMSYVGLSAYFMEGNTTKYFGLVTTLFMMIILFILSEVSQFDLHPLLFFSIDVFSSYLHLDCSRLFNKQVVKKYLKLGSNA